MREDREGVREPSDERTPLLPPEAVPEAAAANNAELAQSHPKRRADVSRLRALLIIVSLACLILMQTANISLLTTIQSSIAEDLQVYTAVSWFASAYLIAMSSTPAIAGGLCQTFGAHNYIFISSLIFSIGTIITATSSNLSQFLVGRAIAGLGASANYPVGIIIIIELTGPERRGLFIGLMNAGFTFGLAMGAILSGALEPVIGWRGIFWIQVPIISLGGIGLFTTMTRQQSASSSGLGRPSVAQTLRSIDYLGIFTLITSIVLLLVSLSSAKILLEPIVFAAILFAAFVMIESNFATNPIIPSIVLRSRGTLLTSLASLLILMARYAIVLYFPMLFMTAFSWGPAQSGATLLAINGGFAVGGVSVGWLHIRRVGSFYLPALITFIFYVICTATLATVVNRSSPDWLFLLIGFINGFIAGASLNYTLAHLLHLTPPATHFVGSSVIAMFRGFGGSFSSAIMGGIFTRVLKAALEDGFASNGLHGREELVTQLLGKPKLVAELTGVEKEVAVDGYVAAIRAIFIASAVCSVLGCLTQAGTGWKEEARGKKDVYGHDSEE